MNAIKVSDLARIINGTIEGNPDAEIFGPGKIENAEAGTITFLGNLKYEPYIYTTNATAVLVHNDFRPTQPVTATLIRVPDVYVALSTLLNTFGDVATPKEEPGLSKHAQIHSTAKLGDSVKVGDFSIIEKDVQIGNRVTIMGQVYIGQNVRIGDDTTIYPGAKIMHNCDIGKQCTIFPNAVVGSDGFGYAPREDGSYKKIAQIGRVILEDFVDIGANAVVDRATMGETIIREGSKIDNLVQIAHNVEVGKHTVIAAQAGIAGSSSVGDHCQIGGQVGMVGHIKIADRTRIQAQSGIATSVKEAGKDLFGYPAIGYRDFLKSNAIFKKLPELDRKIRQLEKLLNELESGK